MVGADAQLEEDDRWESLGQALPDGRAFAWVAEGGSGVTDLGGWRERPGEIEAARLVVGVPDAFDEYLAPLRENAPAAADPDHDPGQGRLG